MRRIENFIEGDIYHVFNKSISNYGIFNDLNNSQRFLNTFHYYNNTSVTICFSDFTKRKVYEYKNVIYQYKNTYCKVLSYCIMPDHYHFLLKLLKSNKLSKLIGNIENSYTRYFNTKFNRRGPLWQNCFKVVKIRFGDQLLRVSRYIHLNPVVKHLANKPDDWIFSSYKDYITNRTLLENISDISIKSTTDYAKYVEDYTNYLKELKDIKKLTLD